MGKANLPQASAVDDPCIAPVVPDGVPVRFDSLLPDRGLTVDVIGIPTMVDKVREKQKMENFRPG